MTAVMTNKVINHAQTKGVIINLSNHRVPQHAYDSLREIFSLREITTFSYPCRFNFEKDLWKQVEEVMLSLKENKKENENCFSAEGQKIILLPSVKEGAVMIALYIMSVLGFAPNIGLIGKDDKGLPTLKQVLDLEAFRMKAANYWRKEILFGEQL
jgi:hypothetical protein